MRDRIAALAGELSPGFAARIVDGDEMVYASPDADQGLFAARAEALFEPAPGVRLKISATAAPGFADAGAPGLPSLFLTAGLLFSVTLSLSILFLGMSRSRLQALQRKRAALVAEIRMRREVEARLQREEAALRASNRNLNEFAYVASHDLREPLRGIGASVGFLIEDHGRDLPEGARTRLDRVVALVASMSALIDDLLQYSRLGTGKAVFRRTALEDVLAEALLRLEHLLEQEDVRIERIGAPLPETVCDGGRIREVFTNLITNALRYNHSRPKRIAIGLTETDSGAHIAVEDNGIGIDPKHREKVFDIFTRLHHRDEFPGGTGAGLSIVRRIVEQHDGRIWIEDAQHFPGGTRFCFALNNLTAPTDLEAAEAPMSAGHARGGSTREGNAPPT